MCSIASHRIASHRINHQPSTCPPTPTCMHLPSSLGEKGRGRLYGLEVTYQRTRLPTYQLIIGLPAYVQYLLTYLPSNHRGPAYYVFPPPRYYCTVLPLVNPSINPLSRVLLLLYSACMIESRGGTRPFKSQLNSAYQRQCKYHSFG